MVGFCYYFISFRLFDMHSLAGVIIGSLGMINILTMYVIKRQGEICEPRISNMARGKLIWMVLAECYHQGSWGHL